jgi:hypothetical protein
MYLAEAEGGGAAAGCKSVGMALLVAAISPDNGENRRYSQERWARRRSRRHGGG